MNRHPVPVSRASADTDAGNVAPQTTEIGDAACATVSTKTAAKPRRLGDAPSLPNIIEREPTAALGTGLNGGAAHWCQRDSGKAS